LIANSTYENTPANLSLTTSYATYTVSAAIDTASTKNIIVFIWSDVTDTTLGDFLYITDVQLEQGASATPFESRHQSIELEMCQRYYVRYTSVGTNDVLALMGTAISTTNANFYSSAPVELRVAATALDQTGVAGDYQVVFAGTVTNCSAVPVLTPSVDKKLLGFQATVAAGLTAGQSGYIRTTSAGKYLGWSAEL
jgi:hypothetical protein